MADPSEETPPVTRQISRQSLWQNTGDEPVELRSASSRLVVDAAGKRIPFGALYEQQKTIVVFVRDANVRLVVVGQSSHHHIKPFCNLTGYPYEMFVDPEREIYRILGMKRGEASSTSVQSPHVKSSLLSGSIKSMWRAMASPAFDFQGDPAQQGGTLILGPGDEIHFMHLDKNRLAHAPINAVLQLAGVQTVDFTNRSHIIDV
ncbi:PREDICTED: thioredoxin-like protein AAED1 isoform X2 [Gekko japonicus]|uniref:Thioredoxin-like protein AAED1 isoform X2 n=1 Tax=Gekko japonicus TaxID=146911 RepID=A0ABM1K372_GEKJA|nr:PREDICTED: thioredoxin-like protein AAED1 isoform X2 [Gekko japonicus]